MKKILTAFEIAEKLDEGFYDYAMQASTMLRGQENELVKLRIKIENMTRYVDTMKRINLVLGQTLEEQND